MVSGGGNKSIMGGDLSFILDVSSGILDEDVHSRGGGDGGAGSNGSLKSNNGGGFTNGQV